MFNQIKHFAASLMTRVMVTREEGQALVEYSLILALVSIASILLLTGLGAAIGNEITTVTAAL